MTQTVTIPGQGEAEFPDNFSPEQIQAAIRKTFPVLDEKAKKAVPNGPLAKPTPEPELSAWDRVKAVPEAAVAAGQGTLAGLAGRAVGLVSPSAGLKVQEAMSPNVSPGAQAVLGAVSNVMEPTKLEGLGPVFAPEMAATNVAMPQRAEAAAPAAKAAQAIPNAKAITEAHGAGYVIPPTQAGGGMVSKALEGFSGKIKTAQKASQANAENTNKLVRQAMNLQPDQPITSDALRDIRQQAGQSYEAIKAIPEITPTAEFRAKVAELGGDFKAAAKEFPDLLKNEQIDTLISSLSTPEKISGAGAIEIVKKLRADATSNLKNFADPAKRALGLAQRKAAEAVDDLVQQNLEKTGNSDLVAQYRKDRQTIAKAHDVEAALNDATGNVSALYLARLGDKGRPLTGELKQVAKFAKAFPKAAQDVEKIGSLTELSVLDYATGGLASLASGHVGAAAAVATRPAIRAGILSKPYQAMLAKRAARGMEAETKAPPKAKAATPPKATAAPQYLLRQMLDSEPQDSQQQPLRKAVGE